MSIDTISNSTYYSTLSSLTQSTLSQSSSSSETSDETDISQLFETLRQKQEELKSYYEEESSDETQTKISELEDDIEELKETLGITNAEMAPPPPPPKNKPVDDLSDEEYEALLKQAMEASSQYSNDGSAESFTSAYTYSSYI